MIVYFYGRYMECSTDDSAAVRYIFNETVRFCFMDRMELSQLHPDYVKYGSTLLHQAVQVDHVPSVEALAYVMDINIKDKAGLSPLDLAIDKSHVASVRCLIKNGCRLVGLTNEDWRKRCEFWIDNCERLNKVHKNINELARKLLNLYASLQDPLQSNLIVIGQNGIEVGNFLMKSAPFISIQNIAIANCQGSCSFNFSHLQFSLHTLTITNCDIGGEIPNSILSIMNLEALSLVGNSITSVPVGLSKLKGLQRLRLSQNKIKSLPDAISGLVKLRFFFCDNNLLERLPDQIGCLGDLEVLDISHNKLEKLSVSLGLLTKLKCLKYSDNRLTFPPAEVIKQGSDEVLEFLNTFLDEPVRNTQVKVTFVGGEGVGKSTLVSALRSKRYSGLTSTDKTYGIEIYDFEFNHSLRMKVFDFCGDPAFLVPHSLFITENSLYQVCFDMSQYAISKAAGVTINQLGRLQLWLEIIHSRAPASNVIIVATNVGHPNLTDDLRNRVRDDVEEMVSKYREEHKKQFEGEPVVQCALCDGTHLCDVSSSHFYIEESATRSASPSPKPEPCLPHIVGYYEVSCKEQYPKVLLGSKNISLQKYKCNLSMKMEILLNTGYLIPHKCLYIRDRILEILNSDHHLQDKPIFTLTQVREIALGCGMKDEFKLKAMLRYFHNQGEFLWFEDISELNDIVIVKPQWLADRLRTLYVPHEGLINDGILRTDYLEKIWPDLSKSERILLLSIFRGLGLAFPCSDVEDLFPNLLPHGYPDRESWPKQPSPGSHQVTVEFSFSFLPPSFFSDLVIAANKRELICPDLAEPSYFRFNLVFATNLKACEGCVIHNKEIQINPLQDNSADQTHAVHLESLPQERIIRVTVRGLSPCCVMPEIRVAIKSVSDVYYQGIRFVEMFVCPTCEITKFITSKKPQYISNMNDEENICAKGHSVGSKNDIMSGQIPLDVHLTVAKPKSAIRAAVENSRNVLDDWCCPKLFIVLPIGFKSPPFQDCIVMDHVTDGYAVHFLCECPGYWHLITAPGYRVRDLNEFFDVFGPRVCKLMKLIFMTGDDNSETHTYASLKDILLKIVIGDPSLKEIMIEDIRSILDHYCNIYPNLIQGCSSFLYEDVEYLVSGKDLSRGKLARLLEIFPEGRNFGPLVCTYSERHKEKMWLCRKHAQPLTKRNQECHESEVH